MLEGLKRLLAPPVVATQPLKCVVEVSGKSPEYFGKKERTTAQLEAYQNVYDSGGPATEAIDCYPLFMLSNGWRLEGDENAIPRVQEFLDGANHEEIFWELVIEALVKGDGFAELALTRVGDLPAKIVPRDAAKFEVRQDQYGTITGYEYNLSSGTMGEKKIVNLEPFRVLHVKLFSRPGSVYGSSLVKRAYDDIIRDAKVAEGTSAAIERHGYPRGHCQVGDPSLGTSVPDSALKDIEDKLTELKPKHDFVTQWFVKFTSLDQGGAGPVDMYSAVSIKRMAAAVGVPGELIGFREGTTDNTAVSRISVFMGKIQTMQRRFAAALNEQVIDRITGKPGLVWIVFNSPNPEAEATKADWISKVAGITPGDAFAVLPQGWMKEQFGVGDYEEADLYADDAEKGTETETVAAE